MAKDDKPKPDAPYQSRPMAAYEGAALKAWGPMRGGAPGPQPTPADAEDWSSGRDNDWYANGGAINPSATVNGTLMQVQEGAAKGYVQPADADTLWAEGTGGDVAGKPSPIPKIQQGIKYSANVPKEGGGTSPLFLTSAKPDEVNRLVSMGVISQATGDKIMSKRNEGDPMQKMRAKTAPAPGMDWAPSASSLPPDHFAQPAAPAPLTSAALPAAPKPTTGDEYASVLQWSRGKWGL